MNTLILGMGYVGAKLAGQLAAAGHSVIGVRRSDPAASPPLAGVKVLRGDLTEEGFWEGLPSFDYVVHTASSGRGGMEAYQAVFERGTKLMVDWLRGHPPRRFIFTSSTSTYAQTDGSLVSEASPAVGAGETGKILRQAEDAFRDALPAASQACILRVAGIYGPGRGHLFLKFLADEAAITGDPDRWLNQVHRDDVVGAIENVLSHETVPPIVNVTDDEPVQQRMFFEWLSQRLNKSLPPTAEAAKNRKRTLTDKRVDNGLLQGKLNYQLKFPTFREGYLAEMKRLDLQINRSEN